MLSEHREGEGRLPAGAVRGTTSHQQRKVSIFLDLYSQSRPALSAEPLQIRPDILAVASVTHHCEVVGTQLFEDVGE
jgi:hypothetical protein